VAEKVMKGRERKGREARNKRRKKEILLASILYLTYIIPLIK